RWASSQRIPGVPLRSPPGFMPPPAPQAENRMRDIFAFASFAFASFAFAFFGFGFFAFAFFAFACFAFAFSAWRLLSNSALPRSGFRDWTGLPALHRRDRRILYARNYGRRGGVVRLRQRRRSGRFSDSRRNA